MIKKEFKDYPNTDTPINAENLNEVQDNIDNAINETSHYIEAIADNDGDFYVDLKDTTLSKGKRLLISFPNATNSSSNARLSIDDGNTYIDIKLLRGTNNIPAKVVENENLELIYNGSKWIVKSNLIAFVELTSTSESIEIPNLNLLEDGSCYELIVNGTAPSNVLSLFYNNDKTDTNYYYQRMRAHGSTVSSERGNNAYCGFFYSRNSQNTINLSLSNGYPTALNANVIANNFDDIQSLNYYQHYINQINITTLTIETSLSAVMSAGTYVKVFKKSV